jgi:Zn-dependent metalloprotease
MLNVRRVLAALPALLLGLSLCPGIATAAGGPRTVAVDKEGIPNRIEGDLGQLRKGAKYQQEDLRAFLKAYAKDLRARGSESLAVRRANADTGLGKRHYRARQSIDGIEVIGGEVIFHVDEATDKIYAIDAQFLPDDNLPRTPFVAGALAVELAKAEAGLQHAQAIGGPQLAYLRSADAKGFLVWVGQIQYLDTQGSPQIDHLLVDATTGRLVERHPQIHYALSRRVYTANNGSTLPGTLLITEGGSSGDPTAQAAYTFSGDTYQYYFDIHARDSWNAAGANMRATVHYRANYNNAFWSGTGCSTNSLAVFGDGDGTNWGPFALALDIVAHEFTHGVTQCEAGLVYANESGALNEAMSDIFGAATEAKVRGLGANTWLIGEDAYTPGVAGDALRYMANPTQDGDSEDYYPERYTGSLDNGGVHWNSGIANLAFYLLTNGGTHPRGKTPQTVPGIGLAKSERIFYLALRDYLQSNHGLTEARNQTARVAKEQYGSASAEANAVCVAWDAVGVPDDHTQCALQTPYVPTITSVTGGVCYGTDVTWSASAYAAYYELQRKRSTFFNAGNYVLKYTGGATQYHDPNTQIQGTYTYKVRACNASGCSAFSGEYDIYYPQACQL